jgi:hypothetical protein
LVTPIIIKLHEHWLKRSGSIRMRVPEKGRAASIDIRWGQRGCHAPQGGRNKMNSTCSGLYVDRGPGGRGTGKRGNKPFTGPQLKEEQDIPQREGFWGCLMGTQADSTMLAPLVFEGCQYPPLFALESQGVCWIAGVLGSILEEAKEMLWTEPCPMVDPASVLQDILGAVGLVPRRQRPKSYFLALPRRCGPSLLPSAGLFCTD